MSRSDPWILGISASHNGAACLLRGDEIIVAVQEERLTRLKREKLAPAARFLSLRYCLETAGITVENLSAVVICPQGTYDTEVNDVTANPELADPVRRGIVRTVSHHRGHAIAALATSGFRTAAILVVDGVGSPWSDLPEDERRVVLGEPRGAEMISLYLGSESGVVPIEKHLVIRHLDRDTPGLPWFGTLGIMFGAIAAQMFGNGLDAGKVMGLAPYGRPVFPSTEFFTIENGRFVFNADVRKRFPFSERWPAHQAEYQDLAASAQAALEGALLDLVARLRARTESGNLCYAGGVALNSIANERIVREGGFDEVYVMPAAEDSGPAIGAAYHGLWELEGVRRRRRLEVDSLGRHYDAAWVLATLEETPGIRYEAVTEPASKGAELLAEGSILGWFAGGSELGPRALGQRSILLDPRRADGKLVLNSRVKFREAFRPFAPAVLAEEAGDWFDLGPVPDSPFMLRVCQVRADKRDLIPAVVHVDGTGRVQTVTRAANPRFHALIQAFRELTSVPILLNTSFNVMGEPIVETPEDALWCLLSTGLDACVIEGMLVRKGPDYRGLLDLVPRVIGVAAAAGTPFEGDDFGERTGGLHAYFEIPTPWGAARQKVPLTFLPVLRRVDGYRTGHDILRAMLREERGLNGRFVELALARLRRARVITFVKPVQL